MSIEIAIFLAIASGFAGFVDAMAGGGGLIQLPALLIGLPNKDIALILGTNKVPSVFGTAAAARNYFKNIKPDIPLTLTMMLPAFIGSMAGAALAASVPVSFFRPFIVLLLITVAIYTWRKPQLGMAENLKFTRNKRLVLVALIGFLIGFYDGIFGPGTGTFLVFFLVSVIGYAFLKASGTAKLVNLSTNIGAILSFQLTGHIWWQLGLLLAFANVTGAIIGSHLAIKGGSALVRKVFLLVVFLLITRVAWDTFIS
ncbi:MAG: sulfite exporter TauE/SafE family protein [Actinobacteria bacterium]|nr:sulfite exporter TauE/SafE family protein [Actinomycetota bacterium]NBY83096.1 sulfite exporter TauE/SafE family protein [Actinomycetota bacterium]NCU77836.1 sulfite exporter TauE/SafE family protein [Actinomycetota bacterium]